MSKLEVVELSKPAAAVEVGVAVGVAVEGVVEVVEAVGELPNPHFDSLRHLLLSFQILQHSRFQTRACFYRLVA